MIQILFFGQLREQLGCDSKQLEIGETTSINGLLERLVSETPDWHAFLSAKSILSAVNQQMVEKDHIVSDADEVAFFPPVTGG